MHPSQQRRERDRRSADLSSSQAPAALKTDAIVTAMPLAPALAPTLVPTLAAEISGSQQFLYAAMIGVLIINLFAPQTLLEQIGTALGLAQDQRGLIAMLPQLGYAAGLLLVVPLTDLTENRALLTRVTSCCALALACAAFAPSTWLFLLAIFIAGATTCAIQMLVPLVASMVAEAHRGKVIGNVMSGLMVGLLLSRPLSNLLVDVGGWRLLYGMMAVSVALVAVALRMIVSVRHPVRPAGGLTYGALIGSLWGLLKNQPVLQLRALTAALCMASFTAFWTVIALLLSQAPFAMSPRQIALFALVGASGAVVAPIAGRIGDRGWTRRATIIAHLSAIAGLVIAGVAGAGWGGFDAAAHPWLALGLLAAVAVLVDAGVTTDQTLGRRAINLLSPEQRGRLNGLFVAIFFIGSSLGAFVATIAWAAGGWTAVCLVGIAFMSIALLVYCLASSVEA
ncbi:MFS transporter [Undibacterium sp.]|uniref:MFS transporter n=1 Tax=Undibacterium sp. TaxID=1914977 RepID=UPI00374D5B55